MNCIFPPALNDKQLFAYMDGESDQETAAHIERCTYCRERCHSLAQFQSRLTSRLYRVDCPTSLQLGEYQLDMLPAPQVLLIAQHLRECVHCAREIAQLNSFLGGDAVASDGSVLAKVKVLIARLVGAAAFPSGGNAPMPALRGDVKGPLTLEADGMVIVLDVQTVAAGKLAILGQVAADNQDYWTDAMVELEQSSRSKIRTSLDDLGGFRCENVEPGPKELRLISKDGAVMVISTFSLTD